MTATTISSRAFNQDTGRAKAAAKDGPVIITDRGRPSHVLLTIEAYQALLTPQPSLAEALRQKDDGAEDGAFDFDPSPITNWRSRSVDVE